MAFGVCCLWVAGRGQGATWKTVLCGKVSVKYPPTWHQTRDAHGSQVRITLTPDSMQNLTMRMFVIFDLPTDAQHNYAYFKKNFVPLIKAGVEADAKIVKTEEITFKEHKTMYAEIISSSLPVKLYGIDAGSHIYMVVLTQRRYSQVADPGIERDDMGILNSMKFGE